MLFMQGNNLLWGLIYGDAIKYSERKKEENLPDKVAIVATDDLTNAFQKHPDSLKVRLVLVSVNHLYSCLQFQVR